MLLNFEDSERFRREEMRRAAEAEIEDRRARGLPAWLETGAEVQTESKAETKVKFLYLTVGLFNTYQRCFKRGGQIVNGKGGATGDCALVLDRVADLFQERP